MKAIIAAAPYLITALLCFFLTRGRGKPLKPERRAWAAISAVVLLLGAVRPYEVYSGITGVLRTSAMTSGWYAERADQQLDLVYVMAFLMAVLGAFILFETRKWHASTRAAMFALLYLAGLLVLNILSLHGLDRLLGRAVAGVPLRWFLDFAGLGAMLAASLSFRRIADAA
jgi:hypothetical protein